MENSSAYRLASITFDFHTPDQALVKIVGPADEVISAQVSLLDRPEHFVTLRDIKLIALATHSMRRAIAAVGET